MTNETECFLCHPDRKLTVGSSGNVFSMVGLGPITDRYLMIAANAHVQSFADMYALDQGIATEIEAVRATLQRGPAPLLMTEHGRVPACLGNGDEHDTHCFHAHFLLFQCSGDIENLAESYFMTKECFEDLGDALAYASLRENYHFLSPHSNKHVVFTGALNVPRQFFRNLVALVEDQPDLADWRARLNREKAIADAAKERMALGR